jgi:threonine dehydratase
MVRGFARGFLSHSSIMNEPMISPAEIRSAYAIIAPHIRRTPIIEVDGADFGLAAAALTLKLELPQHAGPSRR